MSPPPELLRSALAAASKGLATAAASEPSPTPPIDLGRFNLLENLVISSGAQLDAIVAQTAAIRDLLRDSEKLSEARLDTVKDTTNSRIDSTNVRVDGHFSATNSKADATNVRVDGHFSAVMAIFAATVGIILTMWMDSRAPQGGRGQ